MIHYCDTYINITIHETLCGEKIKINVNYIPTTTFINKVTCSECIKWLNGEYKYSNY